MRFRLPMLAALIALLGFGVLIGACVSPVPPGGKPVPAAESLPTTAPPASRLGTVEIKGYEGKPLDAVSSQPETSIDGTQHVRIEEYRLSVSGLVKAPRMLTYDEVLALPAYQKVTTLRCVDGWSVTHLWQGVLLKDVLQNAGYDPNAKLVIFRCYDGYSESLPLDFVVNRNILLAYGMNGLVMPPERGFPFQVVAEDRYGYKWAKWVTSIEVSNDTTFRGHFEKMGADNTATVSPDD